LGAWGERTWVNLDHRAHDHEVDVGSKLRDATQKVVVHPLVDHAEPAHDRTFKVRHVLGKGPRLVLSLRKVRVIDAAAKEVGVAVLLALLHPQLVAAAEDHVGLSQKLVFELHELLVRSGEERQLVHAVVHDAPNLQFAQRPRGLHRAICPQQGHVEVAVGIGVGNRFPSDLEHDRADIGPLRQVAGEERRDHRDVRRRVAYLNLRIGALRQSEVRLLDKENGLSLGESRQELLRSLPDEAPAQVAQGYDSIGRLLTGQVLGRRSLGRGHSG
jgi:hypothetical protein